MKFISIILLLLIAITGRGATPSTKSFRGTGGILVTSNDTTAVITIDGGSVVAGGTNSTIRISTNGVLLTVSTQVNFGNSITGVVVGSTSHVGVDPTQIGAGSSGAVQFNQGGALAGTNRFVYDRTNDTLTITGKIVQAASGVGMEILGALKSIGAGFNLVDSNGVVRFTVSATSGGTTIKSTNGNIQVTFDKDGGMNLPNLTPDRGLMLNANGDVTNANWSVGNFSTNSNGDALFTGSFTNTGFMWMLGLMFVQGQSTFNDFVTMNNGLYVDSIPARFSIGSFMDSLTVTNGFQMQSVTASRAAVFDANKLLTNASGTPDGTKFLRDDNTYAVPAGTAATAFSNLTDVTLGTLFTGDFPQWNGFAWVNVPAFFQYFLNITTTNIFVGTNLEQQVTIKTNASFKLVFTGTPQNGEMVNLSVSNYGASTIYMTNTAYDPTVASNVTLFAIPATSIRDFKFLSNTNFNLGVQRWELIRSLQKESELAVTGGLLLTTNADNSIITISNPVDRAVQSLTVTNNIGFLVGTVAGVGGANTNFTLQASGDKSIIYVNAGTTNVNVLAVMGYSSTIAYRGTLILTNRTATARILSLGAITNNWISLQQFDGITAPFTVTNSLAGRLDYEILGTNVQYSYKPMALPSN